jgi:hypothetical protein
MSSVSILKSYAVRLILAKTSANVKCLPSLYSTTSCCTQEVSCVAWGERISESTYIRALLHLALDKPQQVLLIHASRVMNVSIHLTNIIEISVGHSL